jgi:glycosyltransferase involved in cell wall biosynthesis
VLELIGNGELFEETQAQVKRLGIEDKVNFHGWMQIDKADDLIRKCDIYMVPAIRDCGGCAQLEAMAIGLPVIAANWAGPGQYTDESSGILVDVDTVEGFINGLAQAIVKLSNSPELRIQLGQGAKQRVRSDYLDWDSKVDRVIEIFKENI